jgi:uncharacterized protein YfaP (DUF2135 family)
MKRRSTPILLALCLAFGAVACGGNNQPSPGLSGDKTVGEVVLQSTGSTHDLGILEIRADDGDVASDVRVAVATTSLPAPLPAGLKPIAKAIRLTVKAGGDAFEAPITLSFKHEPQASTVDKIPFVAIYNTALRAWEPTSLVVPKGQKPNHVTIETRAFGVFAAVLLDVSDQGPSQAGYIVPGFQPKSNGWSVRNLDDRYFTPGGNCLGMSSYCRWFFANQSSENLYTKYAGRTAQIVATRVHLAASQQWAKLLANRRNIVGDYATGALMKAILRVFGRPLTALMFRNTGRGGHASVVYGYDDAGFKLYDVNFPGETKVIPFNQKGFGPYLGYDHFGYVALSSVGSHADFQGIYNDAQNGFRSRDVVIEQPTDNEEINEASTLLKGHVKDQTWDAISVFVNGIRLNGKIVQGRFQLEIPLSNGVNPITVLAAKKGGGMFSRNSGVNHIDVKSVQRLVKIKVTLTWEQNGTDVDLYTYEPNGGVSWYADMTTASGGELDIDNTTGFGPEHYTAGKEPPKGKYRIRLHYYSDHGTQQPATGLVTILLNERDQNRQKFWQKRFRIKTSNSDNDDPSSSGPDWVDIAVVDLKNNTISSRNP